MQCPFAHHLTMMKTEKGGANGGVIKNSSDFFSPLINIAVRGTTVNTVLSGGVAPHTRTRGRADAESVEIADSRPSPS